jgi:hypothetical protein
MDDTKSGLIEITNRVPLKSEWEAMTFYSRKGCLRAKMRSDLVIITCESSP